MRIGADFATPMVGDDIAAHRTVPGMAHIAGTGPAGQRCRTCEAFELERGSSRAGRCGTFHAMGGRLPKSTSGLISSDTPACKHWRART